jgi:hypothetical protein
MAEVVGYFRSVLLNTWAKGTFPFPGPLKTMAEVVGYFRSVLLNMLAIGGTIPFPGILIIGAGVVYCFRFHSTEHVGERNIFVSWPYKHKEREELAVSSI